MKFEEQFPSLKNRRILRLDGIVKFDMLKTKDVQKTCVDKEVLREAIKKIREDFKKDILVKASKGDFVINTTLVGANLVILDELTKEMGL